MPDRRSIRLTLAACPRSTRTRSTPPGVLQELALVDEPFDRTTDLSSLDLSYDAGFATISTTSSYYTTDGSLIQDSTFD